MRWLLRCRRISVLFGNGSQNSFELRRSVVTSCRAVLLPRFGGPEVLEVRENVNLPELKPNEVLVRTRAVSVNPLDTRHAIDLHIIPPKYVFVCKHEKTCLSAKAKEGYGSMDVTASLMMPLQVIILPNTLKSLYTHGVAVDLRQLEGINQAVERGVLWGSRDVYRLMDESWQ